MIGLGCGQFSSSEKALGPTPHGGQLRLVQQSHQMSIDAAQTWVKVVSVLPVMELPKVPGLPAMPDLEAATTYTFDLAGDLFNAQRDFALQLTSAFAPAKKS